MTEKGPETGRRKTLRSGKNYPPIQVPILIKGRDVNYVSALRSPELVPGLGRKDP